MSKFHLILASVIAFAQSCASGGHQPDRFAVEPVDVANRIDVVAVAPVGVNAGVTVPDTLLARIDSLVATTLRDGGITVVDPATYERIWAEVYENADPIFDEHTGERDETAYQAAWASFYEKLRTRYQASVVLFPEIWEVDAEVQNGYARWDGASQKMTSTGTYLLALLNAVIPNEDPVDYGPILPNGYVEALSLSVALEDATGEALYTNQAGIESLRRRISSDRVPDTGLLQDWVRIEDAVRRALDPMLDAYRDKGTQGQTDD